MPAGRVSSSGVLHLSRPKSGLRKLPVLSVAGQPASRSGHPHSGPALKKAATRGRRVAASALSPLVSGPGGCSVLTFLVAAKSGGTADEAASAAGCPFTGNEAIAVPAFRLPA